MNTNNTNVEYLTEETQEYDPEYGPEILDASVESSNRESNDESGTPKETKQQGRSNAIATSRSSADNSSTKDRRKATRVSRQDSSNYDLADDIQDNSGQATQQHLSRTVRGKKKFERRTCEEWKPPFYCVLYLIMLVAAGFALAFFMQGKLKGNIETYIMSSINQPYIYTL